MMDIHWVALRCEASRASKATPAVAEASEASKATCKTMNHTPLTKHPQMHTYSRQTQRLHTLTVDTHASLHGYLDFLHYVLNHLVQWWTDTGLPYMMWSTVYTVPCTVVYHGVILTLFRCCHPTGRWPLGVKAEKSRSHWRVLSLSW